MEISLELILGIIGTVSGILSGIYTWRTNSKYCIITSHVKYLKHVDFNDGDVKKAEVRFSIFNYSKQTILIKEIIIKDKNKSTINHLATPEHLYTDLKTSETAGVVRYKHPICKDQEIFLRYPLQPSSDILRGSIEIKTNKFLSPFRKTKTIYFGFSPSRSKWQELKKKFQLPQR